MAVGDMIDGAKIIKEEVLFKIEIPDLKGDTGEERLDWLKSNQPLIYAALRMLGLG